MMWGLVYGALLAALFVRFGDAGVPARMAVRAAPGEPVRLVAAHHLIFYVLLLLVCPSEALLIGGAASGRAVGAVLFALGVVLYRRGAAVLGDALSPLVAPRAGATLVTSGPYRWLRHPMYLGQLLIAIGAPLTLGCRLALGLSAAAAAVLAVRVVVEEATLARTYPEYAQYAVRAKRLVPFVF